MRWSVPYLVQIRVGTKARRVTLGREGPSMILGLIDKARAMLTRCFMPPESSDGRVLRFGADAPCRVTWPL